LHSTQESAAVTGSNIGEKTKRLKISAGISFAGPGVQATVKGGYGSDKKEKNETSSAAFDSQMAWDAKGGDTLLCNKYSPAAPFRD
jgi:hypothetical protein